MKLYKYRSLRRNLDFVLDILLNERLYCANYTALNDPLEGYYVDAPLVRRPVQCRSSRR